MMTSTLPPPDRLELHVDVQGGVQQCECSSNIGILGLEVLFPTCGVSSPTHLYLVTRFQ